MTNELSKALIEHCSMCFLALKGLINKLFKNSKLNIFGNLLHQPSHNNMKKILKNFEDFFEDFLKNIFSNILPNTIPKVGGCNSCYAICTQQEFF